MLLVAALAIVLPAAAAPCCGAMAVQKSAPMMSHPCCAPHCTMKVSSDTQQESDAVLTPASNFQSVLQASDLVTPETAPSVANIVTSFAVELPTLSRMIDFT